MEEGGLGDLVEMGCLTRLSARLGTTLDKLRSAIICRTTQAVGIQAQASSALLLSNMQRSSRARGSLPCACTGFDTSK